MHSAPLRLNPPQYKHHPSGNLCALSTADNILLSTLQLIGVSVVYRADMLVGAVGRFWTGSRDQGEEAKRIPCFRMAFSFFNLGFDSAACATFQQTQLTHQACWYTGWNPILLQMIPFRWHCSVLMDSSHGQQQWLETPHITEKTNSSVVQLHTLVVPWLLPSQGHEKPLSEAL